MELFECAELPGMDLCRSTVRKRVRERKQSTTALSSVWCCHDGS